MYVGKFGKYFFLWLDLSRDFFWGGGGGGKGGFQDDLKARASARISGSRM